MKAVYLSLFIILIVLVTSGFSVKTRKYKKYGKIHKSAISLDDATSETKDLGEDEFKMLEDDEQLNENQRRDDQENEVEVPVEADDEIIDNRVPIVDPCSQVHCGAGRICQVDKDNEPQCICIPDCPVETESRRKVCSNHNETWSSDCAVYQQRCWCDKKDERCKGEEYRHVHIEYYGECREMPECTKEEMADFPRRMRDWLFNIMRDLADRQELTPHYLKMEREAESNLTRRWTNAAVWKFCDLDGHPSDRSVSRHELFPIRAPLMALEHCIAPFLNSCDNDNNHRITIKEWAKCLELNEDEIDDKCEEILE